jgi:hypothetical protein
MFIRSSTATNDCLIALDLIASITKTAEVDRIYIYPRSGEPFYWNYESQEERDKAYDELCDFLNSNYKLRDFT